MEYGYEEKYDLLGIIVKDEFEFAHSLELKSGFIVDIDKDNEICQIQVLGWAQRFQIPKPQVRIMEIEPIIEYGDFCCKVTVRGKLGVKEYKISGEIYL